MNAQMAHTYAMSASSSAQAAKNGSSDPTQIKIAEALAYLGLAIAAQEQQKR